MSAKDRPRPIKVPPDKKGVKEPGARKGKPPVLVDEPVQIDLQAADTPSLGSPDHILNLQRSLGNQVVNRLLTGSSRSGFSSELQDSQRPGERGLVIQRVVPGDVTGMSIDNTFAWALTDAELVQQINILSNPNLLRMPGIIPEVIQQNKAVLDLEKSRRDSPGLMVKSKAEGIARVAHSFWKNNAAKPLKDLSDEILKEVNLLIPHPCATAYATGSDSSGWFDNATWSITVNTDKFSATAGITKVGQLSKEEVAEIVDTIYHEARHSEQAFHIAQMKAGKGKSAPDIATEMGIPPVVAEHAFATPLKGATKAEKEKIAEAISWDDVEARYPDYNNFLQGESVDKMLEVFNTGTLQVQYNNLAPQIGTLEGEIASACDASVTKATAIPPGNRNKLDYTVMSHSKSIRWRFNQLKNEYNKNKPVTVKYLSKLKMMAGRVSDEQFEGYFALVYEIDARKAARKAKTAVEKLE